VIDDTQVDAGLVYRQHAADEADDDESQQLEVAHVRTQ